MDVQRTRRIIRSYWSLLVVFSLIASAGLVAVAHAGGVPPAPKPKVGAPPWLAPSDPLRLTLAAGLRPERKETLIHHVHSHLDVFVNGARVTVPAGIGINIRDLGVKTLKAPDGGRAFGGIQLCDKPCISPLHTHADLGLLHTETSTPSPNRLGQFFTEWGVKLDRHCIGGYCKPASILIYVNGKQYTGNPREILLADHTEIAIVVGTPPSKIPSSFPSNIPL
jgi:hypothetical protein